MPPAVAANLRLLRRLHLEMPRALSAVFPASAQPKLLREPETMPSETKGVGSILRPERIREKDRVDPAFVYSSPGTGEIIIGVPLAVAPGYPERSLRRFEQKGKAGHR